MASRFVLPLADVGNGISPSDGAKLTFFITGTSTLKDTFADEGLTTPNTNPVIADGDGVFPEIWISGGYKVRLTDKNDVQRWEEDPIYDSFTSNSSLSDIDYEAGVNFSGGVNRDANDKLFDVVSGRDAGAAFDGVADDTTKINSTIAAAGTSNAEVVLRSGSALVTALDNDYGVEFKGQGEAMKAVTGGFQRLNTYADKNKYAIGKEYLYRLYSRMAFGQSSSTGTVKAFIYGDSTIAGGNGETAPFAIPTIITSLFKDRGLGNISLTNRGVGGTTVDQMNAIPDLSTTTDLYIIKYGINDAGNPLATRLATFKDALRAKLLEIRNATSGDLPNLAIILVGPNATSDSPNQRDERWYEQLRGVYVQAARDFNCGYFDTYAFLKDARPAAGLWMDNPFADGRAIHPLDEMNAWIWGGVVDWAVNYGESMLYRGTNFTNQGAVSDTWLAATVPSNYDHGIHIQRATVANGAPIEGAVITVKNIDAPVIQMLYTFAANITKMVIRTANTGADSWNVWSGGVEQSSLGLVNSWVDFGDPSFETPSAYIDGAGTCHLQGEIKSGTVTPGTAVANLPTGMAPSKATIHVVGTNAGTCQLKVDSTGQVIIQTTADATRTSLSSIAFKVSN